ncbi:hypothetical protein PanWU01x14_110720 [Parasponia andersonii]|uniref:Uncharacterized protein n=1 Tax=Parasponia andersonii TaxID=3476 RepID=A0A2P5CYU8_PARAD|nr:hypothetical protein PanWU01x14_110720 [Parasponia andersonii]
MAASKSNFHVRSNSLPSQSHPVIEECNDRLIRLGEASHATSASSIAQKLRDLEDLHLCVEKLLQLPLTQQAFVQDRQEKWVDYLVDGSLRLLDMCCAAKDAVLHTKESAREIQSTMRRRRGAEIILENEIRKYSASRKVVKKAIQNALASLKGVESKSALARLKSIESKSSISSSNKDIEITALINVLREMEAITLSAFESLLCFISGPRASKIGGWSLVSKLMNTKRVGCEEEAEPVNEFAKVDAALHCLTSQEKRQNDQAMLELRNLELCVQDFEERLECLFRRLIKTRVAILNNLNN